MVGASETELHPGVATLRRVLVERTRRVEVDRQVELAVFVGASETELRPSEATLRRVLVERESKS